MAARGFLGDYVPFNFCNRSVMLYVLARNKVAGYTGGQVPIVHLVSSVATATASGRPWAFTDRHADVAYARYFDDLAFLSEINWNVMPLIQWAAVKEERQAEFLVHEWLSDAQQDKAAEDDHWPGNDSGLDAPRYAEPGYDYPITVLEIQKLAYFQQVAGEALKLRFAKGTFGPYADELRHVLNHMEGHFIQGFADGQNQPGTAITLLPAAAAEAESFLQEGGGTHERFKRVAALIKGFETPFGMELLSSVHWIAMHENAAARTDVTAAIAGVHAWNERKLRTMHPDHIRAAWKRLREQEWI